MKRGLTLKKERLAELTSDDLRSVAGGEATGVACVTRDFRCVPSNYAHTLCGCLTDLCTIR